MRRLWFSLWYWLPRRPPWDTGVTPPELVRFVESHPAGRALDLGCGTGTNVVYLARHGWSAVGVDFAGRAIAKARRRAREAGVTCTFVVGDVTRLAVPGPFDLALDIGCLHSIPPSGRPGYATGLSRVVRPGGTYWLYAFAPGGPAYGLTREDVRDTFAAAFDVVRVEEGKGRPSAWYTLARR
ncbi:MAG: class I SAM-dependent methyltransferase [Chloroflexi bacterium]|nr:MAG: class I SAM-dependent methyltransferase [Chloroflexota bacterium]